MNALIKIRKIAIAVALLVICLFAVKPALADDHHHRYHGHHHWHNHGYAGGYSYAPEPSYYYAPEPNYYYTPEPDYYSYAPAPAYPPPAPSEGINLFFGIH